MKTKKQKPVKRASHVTLPDDHPHVVALVEESKRLIQFANGHRRYNKGKQFQFTPFVYALMLGNAYAYAATWLRCHIHNAFEHERDH